MRYEEMCIYSKACSYHSWANIYQEEFEKNWSYSLHIFCRNQCKCIFQYLFPQYQPLSPFCNIPARFFSEFYFIFYFFKMSEVFWCVSFHINNSHLKCIANSSRHDSTDKNPRFIREATIFAYFGMFRVLVNCKTLNSLLISVQTFWKKK